VTIGISTNGKFLPKIVWKHFGKQCFWQYLPNLAPSPTGKKQSCLCQQRQDAKLGADF